MSTRPSFLRRAIDWLGLIAALNLFAFVAFAVYTVQSGALSLEKVRHFVAIMRDEIPIPGSQEDIEASSIADSEIAVIARNPLAETEVEKEILRREADRIKAELDQRLALNNTILLRVTTERERFRKEEADAARLRKARSRKQRSEGFKKQLAILESLSPRVASEQLLSMEVEEASRFVMAMQTSRVKKIIESVKGSQDRDKLKVILRRMREASGGSHGAKP